MNPRRAPALLVLLLASLASAPASASEAEIHTGQPLEEALRRLEAEGLSLLFTTSLVRPDMRLEAEPPGGSPRQVLDAILAPHGLAVREGPGGELVVVPGAGPATVRGVVRHVRTGEPLAGVSVLLPEAGLVTTTGEDGRFALPGVPAGAQPLEARRPGFVVWAEEVAVRLPDGARLLVELEPAPLLGEAITVDDTAGDGPLPRMPASDPRAVSQEELEERPHFGEDLLRALELLPGTSGGDLAAGLQVRGGRADEVLLLLDGQELIEPYHLQDYGGSFSIVSPTVVAEANLLTGDLPVRYGDRMGGVLDLRTAAPGEGRRFRLAAGLLGAEAAGSGRWGGGRGSWLGSGRLGAVGGVLELIGEEENLSYWDLYGKLDWKASRRQAWRLSLLAARDTLQLLLDGDGESEDTATSYGSDYLWLTHSFTAGPRLQVETSASVGSLRRQRAGTREDSGGFFDLRDARALDAVDLRQLWQLGLGRQRWEWGFEARRLSTDFEYVNRRVLEDPLGAIRGQPAVGSTEIRRSIREDRADQGGAFLADRFRLGPLTLEAGLRWDLNELSEDTGFSPRLSLAASLGKKSQLRLAWGHYRQSQRTYELQVEDGEMDFFQAERAERAQVGLSRELRGLSLLVEAYHRRVENPRPRWENLFGVEGIFPELEADRVRLAPASSRFRGLEVTLRGRPAGRFTWGLTYAWARVRDRLDGVDVPRSADQPHTVKAELGFRPGRWSLAAAWQYHSGWPTTTVGARAVVGDDGTPRAEPVLGPLHAERLRDYHRLDVRAGRSWQRARGELGFYAELRNLYNRANVRGLEVDLGIRPDGTAFADVSERAWLGLLPSFGVTWSF